MSLLGHIGVSPVTSYYQVGRILASGSASIGPYAKPKCVFGIVGRYRDV